MSKKQSVDNPIRLDQAELCIRMIEAVTGTKRQANCTREEALANVTPDIAEQVIISAREAILYFLECLDVRLAEPDHLTRH
jgi:hypothetical protein